MYLESDKISAIVDIYSQLISEVTVLSIDYESAHLNVRGENFYQYHLLFERTGNDLNSAIDVDSLGERIGSLDSRYIIPVSTALAAKNSQIIQQLGDIPVTQDAKTLLDYLIKATEFLVNFCYTSANYLISIGANTDANKLQEYEVNIGHNLYLLNAQRWGGDD
jgi:DNA-binding ferritin-like protein